MYDTDSFKKDIQDNYDIEEELGSGQFAVVRKIVEKETGDEFAGKYVRKKRTKASRNGMSREDIKREIEILRLVDHEKIIKVHDVYETDREMILVMELLRGGELFDYISKKDFLTEEEAIDFTRQILQGLQHLHSLSVVHLDLKPENILLKNVRRKTIKLVDFGLARVVKENEQVREIMGTPEFVAPEVLNFDTISTATDMWALGVIAYILLSGASPFLGEDNQETFTNIIQVDYQFDEEYFSEISDEAKDFIRKLLVKDPRKRPTAHECSRHTWVEEEVVDKKKRQRRRTTQICTFNFKRFVARKRWKMSFNKVRAMNLIAKMGIKPPPGFITVIPPMPENDVSVQDKVEEKPSHKERKKNTSTINRRKHKQHSSPKATLEKTDSFTLKTMDIDIGETETAGSGSDVVPSDYEDLKEVESSAPVSEPDYATMSLREKRRARGQLRHHEIVKSKEIDAKKIDDQSDTSAVQENPETATPMKRDDKESREEIEPETRTVSSTMHIEHKPAGRTVSGGILKKRETKGARIPSTEDHYYVSLNAALFEQKDPFSPAEEKPQWSAKHGILKHDNKKTSEDKPVKISKVHQGVRGTKNIAPAEATAGINVDVEIARAPEPENVSPIGEPEVEKIQDSEMEKADKEVDKEPQPSEPMNVEPSDSSNIVTKGSDSVGADSVGKSNPKGKLANKNATPSSLVKKSVQSSERVQQQQQQRFSPPPWKTHKSGNEHQKSSQKPLHSVSKVSLKTNRFLANEKQSRPKSPTSTNGLKTSIVLGRAKLFQKESVPAKNSQNFMKTVATKTNSAGDEYKTVSCDINLDEPVKSKDISEKNDRDERSKKGKEIREKDFQHTKHGVKSKASSDSQSKIRSESLEDSTNNNKTTSVSTNRSRSGTARDSAGKALAETKVDNTDPGETELVVYASDIPAADQMKALVNGETAGSEIELSRGEDVDTKKDVTEPMAELSVEGMEEEQAKEELKSTSTHSLTEFTIRPRQNSGEGNGGGFDVLLTIGPLDEQQKSDQRLTSIKSRFTSSSSSALSDKIGVPNGKLLMSSSAVDVTNHSRSTAQVTFQTGDRHNFAQGPKYTPQRDFSKYLTPDQHDKKPTQTSGLSSNNPKTTSSHRQPQPIVVNRPPSKTPVTKGKKQTVSTVYVPRRTFGYTTKPDNQTEHVSQPHSVADDTPKENKNDQSKRWSQSSSTSDRSADSVSSEESRECSVADAKLGNNVHIDSSGVRVYKAEKLANNNSTNINISQKIDNHPSPNPSPHASPVLERKWKATLVLPNKDSEKISSAKERDIRISSSNVPRRNKFTNVRSMWEGK